MIVIVWFRFLPETKVHEKSECGSISFMFDGQTGVPSLFLSRLYALPEVNRLVFAWIIRLFGIDLPVSGNR